MATMSAGILMYRLGKNGVEVLLVHPGGPYWRNKDACAWSIPKGEYTTGEDAEAAARREFAEELGTGLVGKTEPLGDIRQKNGKRVTAFAVEGDLNVDAVRSNEFEMEWPPRSGRLQSFPEVDRAAWLTLAEAREKINPAQALLLDRLAAKLGR
jgi:predicted NUDIX family NTP pyrophosphohydrolase